MSAKETNFQYLLWTDFTAQRPQPDDPALPYEMVRGEYTWDAGEYSEGSETVKIMDVLDEEWFGIIG